MESRLIKAIQSMEGRYSGYEIFSDFVKVSALAIANACKPIHDKVWQTREQEYMDIQHRHTQEEMDLFSEMFGMLAIALEEDPRDVLGEVYMKAGLGSAATGQFFTPWHLSLLNAKLGLNEPCEDGIYRVNEPSCGGGGMIIAAAVILKEKGLNYQRCMEVVAQDLDWKAVYMRYVQLSLLGIKADVVQGDTLNKPGVEAADPYHILRTPARMGMLLT